MRAVPARDIASGIDERATRLRQLARGGAAPLPKWGSGRLEQGASGPAVGIPMRVGRPSSRHQRSAAGAARALHQRLAGARGRGHDAQRPASTRLHSAAAAPQRAALELRHLETGLHDAAITSRHRRPAALAPGARAGLPPFAAPAGGSSSSSYAVWWSSDRLRPGWHPDTHLVGWGIHLHVAEGELHCDVATVSAPSEIDR